MRTVMMAIGAVFLALGATVAAATPPKVLLILDASGSMWGQVEGRTKIEIAREVIRDELVGKLPADMPIGLMAYGHHRKGDCGDIELVAAVGTDRGTVTNTVNALTPRGMTPITAALTQAGNLFRSQEGRAEIILVSDGKETCEGDPCAAAKAIHEAGVGLRVHVIGFDVNPEEEAQLACIAREGGGTYARAENAAQLRETIGEIESAIVAAPVVEKKVIRRRSKGTLSVPNLKKRQVNVCTADSDCYNEASEGFLGRLTPEQRSMELKIGSYRLRLTGSASGTFLDGVEIESDKATEVMLGSIGVTNLDESASVCTMESDCYNSASVGWYGVLTPQEPVIEVFPGTYKLKLGQQYEEDLVVEAGAEVILE